jgi:hypothetical protein
VVARFPEPDVTASREPVVAIAVHCTPFRVGGKASVIWAPRTSEGPLSVTVIV